MPFCTGVKAHAEVSSRQQQQNAQHEGPGMPPGDGVKTLQISWCNQPLPRKKTATNRVSEIKARKKHSRIEISEN
jgi:hypothetical protein